MHEESNEASIRVPSSALTSFLPFAPCKWREIAQNTIPHVFLNYPETYSVTGTSPRAATTFSEPYSPVLASVGLIRSLPSSTSSLLTTTPSNPTCRTGTLSSGCPASPTTRSSSGNSSRNYPSSSIHSPTASPSPKTPSPSSATPGPSFPALMRRLSMTADWSSPLPLKRAMLIPSGPSVLIVIVCLSIIGFMWTVVCSVNAVKGPFRRW